MDEQHWRYESSAVLRSQFWSHVASADAHRRRGSGLNREPAGSMPARTKLVAWLGFNVELARA
jgi:hypothetical protein